MSPAASDDLRRLAEQVAARLSANGETLATAESCTGGMIAATLTDIPGASAVFWGGGVVYADEAKIVLAGIEPEVLRRHGPVSAPTTEALARAIRRRAGSTYGLAVTGWAGPAAGEGGKVGEVHGAFSRSGGGRACAWRFLGDRSAIRIQAAVATLALLREHLTLSRTRVGGADDSGCG